MGLLTDVKAWWSLSDLTENIGGRTLTNHNGLTFETGNIGDAARGAVGSPNSYLTYPNSSDPTIKIEGQKASCSFWVLFDANDLTTGDSNFHAHGELVYGFKLFGSNTLRIFINGGGTVANINPSPSLAADTWYHVIGEIDPEAAEIRVFLMNTGQTATTSTAAMLKDRNSNLHFCGSTGWLFEGLLDEVVWRIGSFWTSAEKTALYNGGAGLSYYDALLAHTGKSVINCNWPLDNRFEYRGDAWANFTEVGGISYTTGKVGNCVVLDGAADYLASHNGLFKEIVDEDFCMGAWINADSIGTEWGILGQSNSSYQLKLLSSGKVRMLVETSGGTITADSTATVSATTWTHVYGYHDKTNNVVGVVVNNGTADTSSTSGDAPVADTEHFYLGTIAGSNLFDGKIDQAFFRRGGLYSAGELSAEYNSGSGAAFATELEQDYYNSTVRKVFIPYPSSSVSGSSAITSLATFLSEASLITNISEAMDADASPWFKGSIRASMSEDGSDPIPISVVDWVPANDPADAIAKIFVLPTDWDGSAGDGIYLWGLPDDEKIQPQAIHPYGEYAVFGSFTFFSMNSGFHSLANAGVGVHQGANPDLGTQKKISNLTYNFDGAADYLEHQITADPTAFTVGAWAMSDSVAADIIICRTNSTGPSSNRTIVLGIDDSSGDKAILRTYDGNFDEVVGSTTISGTTWYHFCGAGTNSGTIKLYLNGSSEGTPASIVTLGGAADRWRIGGGGSTFGFWDGHLDGIFAAYSEFSADQIQTLYDNQNDDASWWDAIYEPTAGDGNGMGGGAYSDAITEGAKAGNTFAAALIISAAISEGAKAGEAKTVINTLAAAIAEGAKAGESWAMNLILAASITEGGVAGNTLIASAYRDAIAEGSKAGDAFVSALTMAALMVEGAKAGDSFTATLGVISAVINEGALAGDTFAAALTMAMAISEGALAGDAMTSSGRGYMVATISILNALAGSASLRNLITGTVDIDPD